MNDSVSRFMQLLAIPTITPDENYQADWKEFEKYRKELQKLYPLVHKNLELTVIDQTPLYRWKGKSSETAVVLLAHYDVVPATDEGWVRSPFIPVIEGEGEDAILYARGTMDNKGAQVGIMEAVESLLESGFTPTTDIYLAFGHDEESFGRGAQSVVNYFKENKITVRMVLDEGGVVAEDGFPGVDQPVAVIGVAERGLMTVKLTIEQQGGHASTPPKSTPTDRMSKAIVEINKHPMPAGLPTPVAEMVKRLGAAASFGPLKIAAKGMPLTKGLVVSALGSATAESKAMIRTTIVCTMIQAGLAHNALAEKAEAFLNVRLNPGDTGDDVIAHLRKVISDKDIKIEVLNHSEASVISSTSSADWNTLESTVAEVFPEAVVTPYLVVGATDSRFFSEICDAVYRFSPLTLSAAERATMHAKNERVRVNKWLRGVEFFKTLIKKL